MAIWLVRAGSHGEHEQKFIQGRRIYLTWDRLNRDLSKLPNREALLAILRELHPDAPPRRLQNWVSQVWPFARDMKKGDLVVLPLKSQPAIAVGEIVGDYQYDAKGANPFYHWRQVKWVGEVIPRAKFGRDLLHSMGAFLTICRIKRNDAEERIRAMQKSGWKADPGLQGAVGAVEATDEAIEAVDLEELGRDQIAQLISARFKGHGLARLVEAILIAQGYTTYRSPEGPDGGVDILAGSGLLGFGAPRLCVQVKSQDTPVDVKAFNELRGAMQSVSATEGLFVAWGGFKSSVERQVAASFFSVRLWTQKELLEQLFANYDKLDEDLRAELPLKRIWTVTAPEADE